MAEQLVEMGTRLCELGIAGKKQGIIGYQKRSGYAGHGVGVEILPYGLIHEKQLGVAVRHKMVDVVAFEIVEDGDCDGTVRETRQGRDGPLRRIAAAQGHFVAAHHARVLEQKMKFRYLARHIAVLERHAVEIGEGEFLPVVAYGRLYIFV